MTNDLPTIAVSIGDPAGIGPEVTIKALSDPEVRGLARWIVVGDRSALEKAAKTIGLSINDANSEIKDAHLLASDFQLGELSPECGRAALEYVRIATELCLDGTAEAIVTAPLNKEAVSLAGVQFTGHTEYIAELCGDVDSRMLLINARLMVLHVTTHCSLRTACDVTTSRIIDTLRLGQETLIRLGRERKKIVVCGLNPHAGENGLFGNEDARVIAPAVVQAQSEGIDVVGPQPADTVFLRATRGEFDMVIAMYHDQGHIPMKLLDFENTVNVSIGLPIVRTSVDHGTAFEIAGKNLANADNMKAAMRLAVTMAANRRLQA